MEKSAVNKKVLVSHSNKQYVHRLIQALLENNQQVTFCTPLWWQTPPFWVKMLPPGFQKRVLNEIRKKSFNFSKQLKIVMRRSLVLKKELADILTNKGNKELNQLNLEIALDKFTADKIKTEQPDIVIGYEISSLATFTTARKQKCITILDLAQIHYKRTDKIAQDHTDMNYLLNDNTIELVRSRKSFEYELSDYILTLSSFAYKSLVEEGINPGRIFTVNLGFDVQLFTPKEKYNYSGPLKLMICGTDMKRKGLRLLLQTLGDLQNRNFHIELSIVGPVNESNPIVAEFPEVKAITTIPFLMHEDLVKEYQRADLFVFPSYLDSWAMTVLEAMACGTPVIVTENTGSKDAVAQGGGVIIPAGDIVQLKQAIEHYYNDRGLLETDGKKARTVAMQYTWDNYNQQIGDVFRRIADKENI